MTSPSGSPDPRSAARLALRLGLAGLAALLVSILTGIAAAPVSAQVRTIPEQAKLAKLKLGVFPDAELDGKFVRLGAGARIYNQANMIVIPSSIKDVTHVVAYLNGSLNEVVLVWILNDAEVRQLRTRLKKSG